MKTKKNFDFSKLLQNNNFIRVLSVLIALIAWLVVSITADDKRTVIISDVPLTINYANSVPDTLGLRLVDGADQTINVEVEGVVIETGGLSRDDIIAEPDFRSVTEAGEHEVPVTLSKVNANTSYSFVKRVRVKMTFDEFSDKTIELTATADNVRAAEGYRKDRVTASPGRITLSGPKAEIDLIASGAVSYDGEAVATDTLLEEGTLTLYDADGNPLDTQTQISHVTYDTEGFSVGVSILMTKTVPIRVEFINDNGKQNNLKYTLSTTEIAIAGRKSVLESINDVAVGPINFADIEGGMVFSLDIVLSSGVYNENNVEQVTVTIDPEAYEDTTLDIDQSSLLLRNIPPDLNVTITSSGIYNVKLVGDSEDIEILSAKELYAIVDVQKITEGTTSVPVEIRCTGNKYVWAVGEYSVTVRATEK